MILGIISDTHDHLQKISQAIQVFQKEQVGAVIHCGDFVAPFAIKLFQQLPCPFYAVFGNNDGERKGLLNTVSPFGELHNPPHIWTIAGKRIYVAHAPVSEMDIAELSEQPDYIVFGHTHKAEVTKCRGITAINPGEACGWLSHEPSIGLLNLDSGEYRRMMLDA